MPSSRAYLLLGHLLFLGLFILAFIHAVPRVVHVDSAFQFFKWTEVPGIAVEAHRYTAIIPQLLVKLAMALGVPLKGLTVVASLAHVLVPYVIFLVIGHGMRQPWLAMGLVLGQVLATRLTFYGIVLEANYLLSYPFLLAAVLAGPMARTNDKRSFLLALAALFLVLLVHPLGAFVALFVLVHHRFNGTAGSRPLYVLMCIALIWPLLGRLLFPPPSYESDLYSALAEGFGGDVPFTQLPNLRFLLDHTATYTTFYLPLWCAFAVLAVLLVQRKAWAVLGLVLSATVLFILIHVWAYHAGETAMYMETHFLPLTVFVALPLVLEIRRMSVRTQWWGLLPFALALFVQFRGISFASRPAWERVDHIAALVDRCKEEGVRKACVDPAVLDARGLHIHWALAFETLLLSAQYGAEQSVTVVARKECVTNGGCVELSELVDGQRICGDGDRYYQLPNGPYVLLSAH